MERYQFWSQTLKPSDAVAKIHVDEVISKVAAFYEKMRGIIDWREEHLLRKTAIERVLKRRMFLNKEGENVAEPLVNELIRGGHFPNDTIPETKLAEIQKMVEKYVYILNNNKTEKDSEKTKIKLHDWLLSVAACEIENILSPSIRETALIEYMMANLQEAIQIKKGRGGIDISDEDKTTQIYIAIQRALFKLDSPIISYNLIKQWYPQWANLTIEELSQITQNIYGLWDKIEKQLRHPLSDRFYSLAEKYDTPYLILGDIISENPQEAWKTLGNPEILENKTKNAYGQRLRKVKQRMSRAAFYSTLSIFITKMILALAVEVPFDKYITQGFNYMALGINVLIPPLLMILLVLSIRPPSKQNEKLIIMEVMKIAYEKDKKDIYEIRPYKKRGFLLNTAVVLMYLSSFFISFGIIIWGLGKLNFSLVSIVIFLAFVCLISFSGTKIKQRAKELKIEKEKENLFQIFIDPFSMPIIQVGNWLSGQWAKYNALAVLFNSLLDMPFQVFIEFLEQWRMFLKEKKEKIH